MRDPSYGDSPLQPRRPQEADVYNSTSGEHMHVDEERPGVGMNQKLLLLPWIAAVALLLAVIGLLTWNMQLRSDLQQRLVIDPVPIETTATAMVQAELLYMEDPQIMVLDVRGLPERQHDEVYQTWLFRDGQPLPVGLFEEPADQVPINADIEQFDAVSITIEPGPIGSPEPTSEPVLLSVIAGS